MTTSFLPQILTSMITFIFPLFCFALFFILIEQTKYRKK